MVSGTCDQTVKYSPHKKSNSPCRQTMFVTIMIVELDNVREGEGRCYMTTTNKTEVDLGPPDTRAWAPRVIEGAPGTHDTRAWVPHIRELLARKDVEGLAGLLKEDDWQVRLIAVCGLGEIGDARIVVPLIGVLRDSDDRVSGEAKRLLRRILWGLPIHHGYFGWERP